MDWIEEADGVFRGGGVKGLGLAGALLGFAENEEKPVKKWVNVAGASAGAIIACYLAAGHDAKDIAELMQRTKFGEFQDFPWPGKFIGGGLNIVRKHGLAPGEAFRRWFDGELKGLTFKSVKTEDGERYRLKLIAVDVTNRNLLVLPDDLHRYRLSVDDAGPIDPDEFPIANAARMSMSIPYFFEPVVLVRDRVYVEDRGGADGIASKSIADRLEVEHANEAADHFGEKQATYRELTKSELKGQRSVIIDGGTLSNFPVWLFDVDNAEKICRPTFGFTLVGGRGVGAGLNATVKMLPWAFRFGFDIFHTSQEAWDTRFVSQSTRVRTVAVDAGNVGTTQFNLSDDDQAMLIRNGREAAKRFLERFDLTAYTNTFGSRFVGPAPALAHQ